MPTVPESICCQEAGLDHLLRDHSCITMLHTFSILCREVYVLEVAMLSLKDVRAETLERPVNSRLTAYRQFTLWVRGHLGKKDRIPIPACSIKAFFPSPEYHGFEYAYNEKCYRAVRMEICSGAWQPTVLSLVFPHLCAGPG